MSALTQDNLEKILCQHKLWLLGDPLGKKADLSYVDLKGVNLEGADLRQAVLPRVDFSASCLRGAKFGGAILDFTNFSEADCADANFEDANLSYADLENACLVRSDLSDAWLGGANLTGAGLSLADLRRTVGNGREILTVRADWVHVNITNNLIWINEHPYSWEQWINFSDADIEKLNMGDDSLAWWHEWEPKLTIIINEHNLNKIVTATVSALFR